MQLPADKPITDAAVNSTASDVPQSKRLTKQQLKFRMWQGKVNQTKSCKTQTKRRPSMPPLPWDPSK